MRILIAEDERSLNRVIKKQLTAAGYSVDCLSMTEYDLAVLDVMMPVLDGFELVRRLRAIGNSTPVIFLTARDDIEDRVCGLDIGADDYLAKPFGMMEMVSRVRAVLRRSAPHSSGVLTVGPIALDVVRHRVTVGGNEVALTLKEFELLRLFAENKGVVFTRDQLLAHIWGVDYIGETRTVDVHIGTLRTKLGDAGELIETVRGVGYRMEER